MALQSLDIERRSATTTPVPGVRTPLEVAKLIDVTTCIGCKACQVSCSEWNDIRAPVGSNIGVYDNPIDLSPQAWTVMRYAEVEEGGRLQWLIRKDGCMHCADPGCVLSCPAPDAIVQFKNGIVDFHQEHCTGCGYCLTGCPFNIPRLSEEDGKVYKCSLCSDRVAVGQEPSCVKTCPTGALRFGSKEDMQVIAAERIANLQQRGFANAGLYDPPGVGGTHVMYVLHHADRPELYGLPQDPAISPLVELWKGLAKPLAIATMALVGFASLFHYVTKGPNAVSKEIEKEEEAA
ncbi:formate dehydrogenase subunit beta [Thiobaca trueperi]|uniref:Formate dehydrogenase iron-sulfur subunit n=1 Tax=Thiobaca trueperi TaxID=127458 RepID=A0A4R3MSS1_9GAMM|nr:formate dehydrogenase subunit beta [Thiobaca trueperi]TCT19438.1 formate dehydrogenase (quinone-dependent) iron-sulfur subunit [Thiobaca trueperi]